MGYVDKAVQAHLGSTLHTGFTSMNAKVADITHADTNKHEITLAAMGLPANVVCMILTGARISGTGVMKFYPNEGTQALTPERTNNVGDSAVIGIINQRLQYNLTQANDDFDLYCMGYWSSGRVLG